ncbi:hypothetical protein R5R35_010740 [Gryllus longicercus]|uniref:Uncharacterized protein n=1 Tax=Gryllus longicercus TaxID=2509291 RepID=A0AAN9VI82_9ORTH
MHQTDHYEALRERGHDPNMIIFSEPARRESIKGETHFSNSLNDYPVDKIKSSSRYQKLPLRMLISQTAYRDPETRFHEKKQLNFPSKSQEDILSVSAKIMQRDTYPYSQYSRHTKHDVVSSSIKMWLKNPHTRNSSKALQTSGFIEDSANCSELNGFPRNSSIAYNESCEKESLFIQEEIFKTEDIKKNEINGIRECSHNQFESDDNKDVPNRLTIHTEELFSFGDHNFDYENNELFNDRFYLSRMENSQISPSKYSIATKTNSIEFIWDPVTSQSLNEINFDFQEKNLNVSPKSSTSSSSNSYPNEYYHVSDHIEFLNADNSFTSFENISEK